MNTHEIRIHGTRLGRGIPSYAFQHVYNALVDGAEQAVRLHVEGRSTAPAAKPAWLTDCAVFTLVPELSAAEDTFTFRVEDEPLQDRDPARFGQRELFEDAADHAKSAIELFEDAIEAVGASNVDSDLFDAGLLDTLAALGRAFRHGITGVEIANGRTVPFTPAELANVEMIRKQLPRPQYVRVAGKLEGMQHTRHRFVLKLPDGALVRGLAEGVDEEELRQLWGRDIVVEGMGHFRANRRIQRIDATRVSLATDRDMATFARQPLPLFGGLPEATRPRSAAGAHWLDGVWGKWPGEETDEEIAHLLTELS